MLAAFFTFCMCFYVWFILDSAWRFTRKGPPPPNGHQPRVSVIIPARNEEDKVVDCLKAVLSQDYPKELLQVILVNDHSTDRTASLARSLIKTYSNLIVLDLDSGNQNSYKKAAISQGIAIATGDIILQTDADCLAGSLWVQEMVKHFSEETALVSGPVMLKYRQGKWLEMFQSLESMGLVVIGAGSLLAGRPNMCNGANMAYRKSVFEEVGGFTGIDEIASGDDELLLQKIFQLKKYQIDFAKEEEAIVSTWALPSWKALKSQRLRWVSKARFYPNRWVNLAQALSYLSFLGLLLMGVLTLFWPSYGMHFWVLLSAKLIADMIIMYQAANFFHKLPLLTYFLPLQPVYLLYVLWIGIAGNLVKTYTWKDRTVK